MDMTRDQDKVLEALAGHEEAIAALYQQYGRRFPADAEFWLGLARDEEGHAKAIRMLKEVLSTVPGRQLELRFSLKAINSSLDYIGRAKDRAGEADLRRSEALEAAATIETSLLEEDYFKAFKDDDPGLAQVLETLLRGTRLHLQRLRDRLREAVGGQ